MERNFKKSAKRRHANLRDPRNRLRIQNSIANDAKPARSFGNKHVAIREERKTPRVGKPGRNGADANALHRGIERLRELRQRG
jgi:hypothetical protein